MTTNNDIINEFIHYGWKFTVLDKHVLFFITGMNNNQRIKNHFPIINLN